MIDLNAPIHLEVKIVQDPWGTLTVYVNDHERCQFRACKVAPENVHLSIPMIAGKRK